VSRATTRLQLDTLDKANGVFIMPALHISTSTAGGSYAAANDATDDRSCGTMRKSTEFVFKFTPRDAAAHVEIHDAEGNICGVGRCSFYVCNCLEALVHAANGYVHGPERAGQLQDAS
jgi:hypothetical protein